MMGGRKSIPMPRTLFEKLWEAHVVRAETDAMPAIVYADLHLVHEVTSAPVSYTHLTLPTKA